MPFLYIDLRGLLVLTRSKWIPYIRSYRASYNVVLGKNDTSEYFKNNNKTYYIPRRHLKL